MNKSSSSASREVGHIYLFVLFVLHVNIEFLIERTSRVLSQGFRKPLSGFEARSHRLQDVSDVGIQVFYISLQLLLLRVRNAAPSSEMFQLLNDK